MNDKNTLKEGINREEFAVMFEPKFNRRFITYWGDSTGKFLPSFVTYLIDRPKCSITYNILGKTKIKWLPINAILYDPIIPSSSLAIMSHINRKEHFNLFIDVLGPVGDVVESWEIKKCKIKSVDFGMLNWKATEHSKIDLLGFDYKINGEFASVSLVIDYKEATLV